VISAKRVTLLLLTILLSNMMATAKRNVAFANMREITPEEKRKDRRKEMIEKRDFPSGVTSTKQTRLALIPHRGLINAAKRFEEGLQKHGDKAWNALSPNQAALTDVDWLIERCSHGIEHLYRIIDELRFRNVGAEGLLGDAGAVAWCGLVLGEALCILQHEKQQPFEYDVKDGGPGK
jgi:hypothetical protein